MTLVLLLSTLIMSICKLPQVWVHALPLASDGYSIGAYYKRSAKISRKQFMRQKDCSFAMLDAVRKVDRVAHTEPVVRAETYVKTQKGSKKLIC